MRLASFNVENMFERPRVMNKKSWAEGKSGLDDYYQLNRLISKAVYTPADKARMLTIMKRHKGLLGPNKTSSLIRLRDIRGGLFKLPKGKPAEIIANERKDWIGWFELLTDPIDDVATENTARVFKEVNADVIAVVEADNRVALKKFNQDVIPKIGYQLYGTVMLIDGNDERGIDVGLMCRTGYEIDHMRSHVEDRVNGNRVFSRDCPEYLVTLPSGLKLLLLVNHFKSKGHGNQADNDKRRTAQTTRVRQIYNQRKAEGIHHIAVLGDFNDIPDSAPLAPLLADGELKDFSQHPSYIDDGRPGSFGNGTKSGKFDYILLSPALFATVQRGSVMRKGVWGGTNGTLWEHFDTMKKATDAASDHAAVWVDLSLS